MNERDRSDIIDLVNAYATAVGTGDADEMAALWCGRADDTMISITHDYHGPEAVLRDFLAQSIHGRYASIRLDVGGIDLRPLTDDVCVVVFTYRTVCVRREDGSPYGIEGIETQVVARTEDSWKLAHVHYSKRG